MRDGVLINLPWWIDVLIVVGFAVWLNQQRRWSEWRRRNDTNPPPVPERGPILDLFGGGSWGEVENPVKVIGSVVVILVLLVILLRLLGIA